MRMLSDLISYQLILEFPYSVGGVGTLQLTVDAVLVLY